MVMFVASKQSNAVEGVQSANIDEGRAAAANQLLGICIAIDPKGYRDLDGLVQTLWRVPSRDLPGVDAVTLESLHAALARQHDLILRAIPSAVSTKPAGAAPEFSATEASDELVRYMVDRFLSWKLPDSFSPDGGITFTPVTNEGTVYAHTAEPSGTNLFDAQQAEAMIRHMLGGLSDDLPGPNVPPVPQAGEAPAAAIVPPPVSAEIENVARLQGVVIYMRDESDELIIRNYCESDRTPSYGALMLGDLRALLRAAGLFTDDMLPSQPPPAADASVKPADGDAAPPPADAEGPCPVCGCAFGELHATWCPVPDDHRAQL